MRPHVSHVYCEMNCEYDKWKEKNKNTNKIHIWRSKQARELMQNESFRSWAQFLPTHRHLSHCTMLCSLFHLFRICCFSFSSLLFFFDILFISLSRLRPEKLSIVLCLHSLFARHSVSVCTNLICLCTVFEVTHTHTEKKKMCEKKKPVLSAHSAIPQSFNVCGMHVCGWILYGLFTVDRQMRWIALVSVIFVYYEATGGLIWNQQPHSLASSKTHVADGDCCHTDRCDLVNKNYHDRFASLGINTMRKIGHRLNLSLVDCDSRCSTQTL